MKKPPSVLAVIGKAITDITGDPHQGRLEVAQAVTKALAEAGLQIQPSAAHERFRYVCPDCGSSALASRSARLVCGRCCGPMQWDVEGSIVAQHADDRTPAAKAQPKARARSRQRL